MCDITDELITAYKNDLVECDIQLKLMRILAQRYRHNKDIRRLAIDCFSLLTQERAGIWETLNFYLSIGKKQNESAESAENVENQNSPQD